jgi:hypothetical protein
MHSLPLDPDKKHKKWETMQTIAKKQQYATAKILKRKTTRSGPLSPTIAQK